PFGKLWFTLYVPLPPTNEDHCASARNSGAGEFLNQTSWKWVAKTLPPAFRYLYIESLTWDAPSDGFAEPLFSLCSSASQESSTMSYFLSCSSSVQKGSASAPKPPPAPLKTCTWPDLLWPVTNSESSMPMPRSRHSSASKPPLVTAICGMSPSSE